MELEPLLERMESEDAIDGISRRLAPLAKKIAGAGARKDLLSGTWLGHPAHPMLVFAPLSFFTAASTLDLIGGRAGRRSAQRLVGLGLVTSLPAAAAGMADWSDTSGAEQRVGAVHAMANTTALALYAASWRQRRRGDTVRGVVTGLAGSTLLAVGGYLGGHLTYRRGVGVDTTVFQAGPQDWRRLAAVADLPEGQPHTITIDGVPLLAVRRGPSVSVLEARCTHRGGPLQDGEIDDGCVTCPWHGSTFELSTGAIVNGPATAPAPSYQVRVVAGDVEIRRQDASTLRTATIPPASGS